MRMLHDPVLDCDLRVAWVPIVSSLWCCSSEEKSSEKPSLSHSHGLVQSVWMGNPCQISTCGTHSWWGWVCSRELHAERDPSVWEERNSFCTCGRTQWGNQRPIQFCAPCGGDSSVDLPELLLGGQRYCLCHRLQARGVVSLIKFHIALIKMFR